MHKLAIQQMHESLLVLLRFRTNRHNASVIYCVCALLSLNVNGLRDIDKLNSVFAAIKSRHANIKYLQETFWDDNVIEIYKHLWEGKIFYKNRRGVAILISKECSYNFIFNSNDTEGRILKINVKMDNDVYSLVIVYAPDDINEFLKKFKELTNLIDSKNTIVAGDFNKIFYPSLDWY